MRTRWITRGAAWALLLWAGALAGTGGAVAQPARNQSLFHLLDYTVRESGPLRFAGRNGPTVQLREQARRDVPPAAQGVMEVFPGWFPRAAPLPTLAREHLQEMRGVQGLTVRSARTVPPLDDLPAYEIVADARDSATGIPVTLYQLVVPDQDRLVVFRGRTGTSRERTLLPHFRQVAESFRRTGVLRGRLGAARYEVTGGFAPAAGLTDDRVAVYRDIRGQSALFVAGLPAGTERDSVAAEAARRLFGLLAPGEPQPARWMRMRGAPVSRIEIFRERRSARAPRGSVLISLRHFRGAGGDFLVGHAFLTPNVNTEDFISAQAESWLVHTLMGTGPEEMYGSLSRVVPDEGPPP